MVLIVEWGFKACCPKGVQREGMLLVPSSMRRGGCAIKKSCEATFDAQTGGVKNISHHPVRSY